MIRYQEIYTLIREVKPKTILEIGTWDGMQAVKMITEAKKYNQEVFYYGFDLFEDISAEVRKKEAHVKRSVTHQAVDAAIKATGASYQLIRGNTLETLPVFATPKILDFVYIDGGHSIETIKSDWDNVERLMSPNTVVLFDDYYHNTEIIGCKQLVSQLDGDSKYSVVVNTAVDVVKPVNLLGIDELKISTVTVRRIPDA